MTVGRKYQWMLAWPLFVIFVPLVCGLLDVMAREASLYHHLRMFEALDRVSDEYAHKVTVVGIYDQNGRISFSPSVESIRRALEEEARSSSAIRDRETQKIQMYNNIAHMSAHIVDTRTALLLLALFYYLFLYCKSYTLRAFLRSRGYDMIGLRDAGMIYASVGHQAFALPKAETVLVIPGYGADPEGLVQYLRDHADYRKHMKSVPPN